MSMNDMEFRVEQMPVRYWEIDLFRGIAIMMMVVFHLLFDINFYRIMSIEVNSGFWRLFAILTASCFVFIVGLSLSISHARSQKTLQGADLYLKYLKRGIGIFSLGILISIVTYVYMGDGFVLFGILHLIGLSIIIAPFFFGFRRLNLLFALIFVILGGVVAGIEGSIWLAWIGIHPSSFYSVDYEPLLPWFGVVLMGLYTGMTLYPEGKRQYNLPDIKDPLGKSLVFLGRHSLLFYMLHQPVIIVLLFLITGRWP